MATVAENLTEIETLRKELADVQNAASERAEAHKRQLSDAKARAKAVIQRKMNEANARMELMNEQNALQAQELGKLKDLVREADEKTVRLTEQNVRLAEEIQTSGEEVLRIREQYGKLEKEVTEARSSANSRVLRAKEEATRISDELVTVKDELSKAMELAASRQSAQSVISEETSPMKEELEKAKLEISELRITCDELREENTTASARELNAEAVPIDLSESPTKVSALWEELRETKERAESLSNELLQMKQKHSSSKTELEEEISTLKKEKLSIEGELENANEKCSALRDDLARTEISLQNEKAKRAAEEVNKSAASSSDEQTKILEAKISEMERLVASKQSEIGRVRDKAKTYLRELNAEKRQKEEKMQEELDKVKRENTSQEEKLKEADRRVEESRSEVENCLTLIREKQKSVQMLKMTISTQETALRKAETRTDAVHAEFMRYKERARLALREKETAGEEIEETIQQATVSLRQELETIKRQNAELKQHVRGLKELEANYKGAVERAERAEAAVDLLRKDTGGSSFNINQIDMLQEQVIMTQNELASARLATEDSEARHETTKMRLEVAERALRAAEVRTDELQRISAKKLGGLTKQVRSLEAELKRAEESSAAAQRTAAAAAKALVLISPDERGAAAVSATDLSPRRQNDYLPEPSSPFASPDMNGSRSSFSAMMEGHSENLGVKFGSPHTSDREIELKKRDQQIAVLTTQLEELGALLTDVQGESELRAEQTALLKEEVKNLDAKLEAAQKLQNGAPFNYLRTIVVRYLETDDATLLPVIANVLSFTEDENLRVRATRGGSGKGATAVSSPRSSGYFSIPFLGSR